jgi:hypothetical protein
LQISLSGIGTGTTSLALITNATPEIEFVVEVEHVGNGGA